MKILFLSQSMFILSFSHPMICTSLDREMEERGEREGEREKREREREREGRVGERRKEGKGERKKG